MSEYQKMWKEFEANEISHSVAHYLLAVADHTQDGASPRAADIARTLEVSRAAVSLQLRTLKEHHLVEVTEDHRIHLTPLGQDLVGRIASKRQVLRAFLCEILGVDPVTAEADACKIEHLVSEETGAALVRFMTFLRSEDTNAQGLLEHFSALTADCPPEATCDFCVTECLLNSVGRN
ncbi:MAG: metal-dependent transcriptional regulator [Acidobacteriota bacterium]